MNKYEQFVSEMLLWNLFFWNILNFDYLQSVDSRSIVCAFVMMINCFETYFSGWVHLNPNGRPERLNLILLVLSERLDFILLVLFISLGLFWVRPEGPGGVSGDQKLSKYIWLTHVQFLLGINLTRIHCTANNIKEETDCSFYLTKNEKSFFCIRCLSKIFFHVNNIYFAITRNWPIV